MEMEFESEIFVWQHHFGKVFVINYLDYVAGLRCMNCVHRRLFSPNFI